MFDTCAHVYHCDFQVRAPRETKPAGVAVQARERLATRPLADVPGEGAVDVKSTT